MKQCGFLLVVSFILFLVTGCGGATSVGLSVSAGSGQVTNYETVESRIDGDFEGWDGDTVFQLENGQVWQQSSYAYTYYYAYRPDVRIYDESGVWKMKVDGLDEVISVERLK